MEEIRWAHVTGLIFTGEPTIIMGDIMDTKIEWADRVPILLCGPQVMLSYIRIHNNIGEPTTQINYR